MIYFRFAYLSESYDDDDRVNAICTHVMIFSNGPSSSDLPVFIHVTEFRTTRVVMNIFPLDPDSPLNDCLLSSGCQHQTPSACTSFSPGTRSNTSLLTLASNAYVHHLFSHLLIAYLGLRCVPPSRTLKKNCIFPLLVETTPNRI